MINSKQIEDLHPVVQELCRKHIDVCAKRGIKIIVTSTLRDQEYQSKLYAQGRTTLGEVVTNMLLIGPHGFGLAYDVVPVVDEQAVWNNNKLWSAIGEEGQKLGLEWGGSWKSIVDKPHFEYTGGLTAAQLRAGKRPSWWEVKALNWKEIIQKAADSPAAEWEKAINILVSSIKAAKANGNIGDIGILEYIPTLIEKVYSNRG